jgi:hypothetical protein
VNCTYPLIPGLHFEGGLDVGFIDTDAPDYLSLYGYARFCMFFRFKQKGGLYLGPGVGIMNSQYPKENISDNTWMFDLGAGVYVGSEHHLFRIGYAMRANLDGFDTFNHRIIAGYAYRFD